MPRLPRRTAAAALTAWAWAATHRPAWGVIAAVAWAAILFPFIDGLAITVVCGIAFGAVSAATLPAPPPQR